uniref:BSD domain-containing protein n=1 Tax=Timspurckia oligopyrenoides TaxID=708627 RepID=A0A7S0ZEV1_9RHOD
MNLIERECRYRKVLGTIRVSSNHIVWSAIQAADGMHPVRVPVASIQNQQVSAAGSKSALIRLVTVDAPKGIIFDFGPNGFASRDAVKNCISPLIPSSNKQESPQQTPPAQSDASIHENASSASKANASGALNPAEKLSVEEIKRRAELLRTNVSVRRLHEQLVSQSHAVSDNEFWKGITFRLKKECNDSSAQEHEQGEPRSRSFAECRGIPSALLSELKGTESGNATQIFRFTPAIIHQIFVENPAVHRAYRAMVPRKMSEERFWKRYVERRVMQSSGGRGGEHDRTDLFAKFELEAEKEAKREVLERAQDLKVLELQLDRRDEYKSVYNSGAHADDGSSVNAMAVAGKQRDKFLPLVRRFNRHGALVLDTQGVSGETEEEGESLHHQSWSEPDHRRLCVIDDLDVSKSEEYIPLKIRDVSVFVDSKEVRTELEENIKQNRKRFLESLQSEWKRLKPNLKQYCEPHGLDNESSKLIGRCLDEVLPKH